MTMRAWQTRRLPGRQAPSPPLPLTVAFFLLHPPRAPRRRCPGGLRAGSGGETVGGGRAGGTGGSAGRAGGRPPPGRLRTPGSAPGPARRRRERGRQLAAAGRPPAHTPGRRLPPRPPPAAPRHERRRWLQAESLPPRPPLAPVRRHYSLFAASGGDGVGLGRRLHLYRGPSCEGKAPSAGVRRLPVPPPSPRLSPAPASSSCSSYRCRPGHRQHQPPPTEDSQPGSQPAPPSAECAAAAHGNSRARSGGARAAPPSALEAEVAEGFRVPSGAAEGFLRERESGSGLGPGGGEEGVCLSAPAALAAYRRFKAGGGNLQEELGSGGSAPRIRRETWRPPAGPFSFGARRPWDSGQLAEFSRAARTARPVGHTFGLRAMTCPDRVALSSGEGNGNPLLSCLKNPKDRGAWRATAHLVAKSRTRVKQLSRIQILVQLFLYNLKETKTSLKLSDLPTFTVRTEELISKILVASYFYFEDQLIQLTSSCNVMDGSMKSFICVC
ncbi:hypothetical protein R6Z07F_003148 [Ovis aries]